MMYLRRLTVPERLVYALLVVIGLYLLWTA